VTLTLTLREAPAAPVLAGAVRPDRIAGMSASAIERLEVRHGNRAAPLGELFAVEGGGTDDVRVAGDLHRVSGLGAGMAGGRLTIEGHAGPPLGASMRRASIVAMTPPDLPPTYLRACTYRPSFLRLALRRLRALGLPVTDAQVDGRYTRWAGDVLELRRAEILILET
jgi:hypothetical protein